MTAARGPARGNTLNAREPDARKIFFLPVPEARGLFKARARCPKNKKIFLSVVSVAKIIIATYCSLGYSVLSCQNFKYSKFSYCLQLSASRRIFEKYRNFEL